MCVWCRVAIIKFDKNMTEEIRQDVSRLLRTSRPPRKDLSSEEHQTLRDLQQKKKGIDNPPSRQMKNHSRVGPRKL